MNYKSVISYISVIFNIFYLGLWIYLTSIYQSHTPSKEQFDKIIIIPEYYREFILIILTIYSVIIFGRSHKVINKILLVIQSLIGFLLIWQFL